MWDTEVRLCLSGSGKYVEVASLYIIDPDGQVRLVSAWEVGPFSTVWDTLVKAAAMARRDLHVVAKLA